MEFRPDPTWAVVTGLGAAYLVFSSGIETRPGSAGVAGMLFALAILVKPTTFAMTGVVFLGCWGARTVLQIIWPQENTPRIVWRAHAIFLGVFLLITLPYLSLNGMHIWNYFWSNSFGANKDVWQHPGDWQEQLLYYLTRGGAKSNIGASGLLVLAPGLVAYGYLLIVQTWRYRMQLVAISLLLVGVYTANVLGNAKTPFLGGAIYGIAYLLAAVCIGEMVRLLLPQFRSTRWVATIVIALMATGGWMLHRWPPYSVWDTGFASNYALSTQAFANHLKHAKAVSETDLVLLTQSGPVVPEVIQGKVLRHNLPFDVQSAAFHPDLVSALPGYPEGTMIVVPEPNAMGTTPVLPIAEQIPTILDTLGRSDQYVQVLSWSTVDGKKVFVWRKGDEVGQGTEP